MKLNNKIVTFRVFRGEDGYYVAINEAFGIHTQGKTFERLLHNIKEATAVSLKEIFGSSSRKNSTPAIMMNIDFSEVSYA
ncbi:MAG: type II toxin-antitoxin system HicB family antitoxin [Candidatus Pacebacteria bacterium]|nr:type II toxin-antitoxin system HicB family antitoxin [Candidatus Paceibacterota bacterium]